MNRLAFPSLALFPLTLLATPALAHFGDHTGMNLREIFDHVFETDHIVFAAIAVLTGILAYRAGKKAGACQQVEKSRNERGDA